MDSKLIYDFTTALGMKRHVAGVKFLFLKEEYEDAPAAEYSMRGTFCAMTGKAMDGTMLKAKGDSFSCQGGPEMLGMKPVSNYVRSGKQFSTFRLYESSAISRQVQQELSFIEQKIYGVVSGPLEEILPSAPPNFDSLAEILRNDYGYRMRPDRQRGAHG